MDDGVKLTAGSARFIADFIRRKGERAEDQGVDSDEEPFLVRLSSVEVVSGATTWHWTRVKPDSAAADRFSDLSPTVTGTLAYAVGGQAKIGDVQSLYCGGYTSDEETPWFYFFPPGSRAITFKIISACTGNAWYNVKTFTDPTADQSGGSNAVESDLGTLAGSVDAVMLNVKEIGVSNTGHDLLEATNTDHFSLYGTGRVVHTNADGKLVIHASEFWVGCES